MAASRPDHPKNGETRKREHTNEIQNIVVGGMFYFFFNFSKAVSNFHRSIAMVAS